MGYKTMRGREIDLDKIMRENELMPAIGNMKVNARGDELGPGGVIIRKREDIVAEYYEDNPNAAPNKVKTEPVQEQSHRESAAPIHKMDKKRTATGSTEA